MPSTGTPASNSAGSTDGAPSAYTLDGPPDRMIATGSLARICSTVAVWGTISEYTCASRTRRAMSCAYCAPKSTTRTGRCCGVAEDGCGGFCAAEVTPPRIGGGHRLPAPTSAEPSAPRGLAGRGLRGAEAHERLGVDTALEDEGHDRHDTGEDHRGETTEAPAHLRPEVHDGREVHHVDPPVRERHPADPGDHVGAHADRVLEDHLEAQDQQHRAGDPGHDAIPLQCLTALDRVQRSHVTLLFYPVGAAVATATSTADVGAGPSSPTTALPTPDRWAPRPTERRNEVRGCGRPVLLWRLCVSSPSPTPAQRR